MNVAAILARKGGKTITAGANADLRQAAMILDENRIGAVVVVDANGALAGVLSERDIVRALARNGPEALSARVSESMSRDVVTCRPGDSLNRLMELMTDRRIRHLPVVQDGKLAGVVSIGDVVKQKIAEAEAETEAMKTYIATG